MSLRSTDVIKLSITALIICLITVAVYLPALGNGFVNWDDPGYVYNNLNLRALDATFIKWSFVTFKQTCWNPLTWLSFGLDHSVWEFNPVGYHLTNILLHAANTFLVVLLTGILFSIVKGSLGGQVVFAATVVGVIFGLHPLHVESVVWVSERKDVLYSYFWLLSILAYLGYATSGNLRKKVPYYLLCLVLFMLSLCSKPMAVTLPVVLLILDFYPLKRFHGDTAMFKGAIMEKVPFLLLSIASSMITIVASTSGGATNAMKYFSLGERLWNAEKALVSYLFKTVLPVKLIPYYPLLKESLFTWESLASLFIILCVSFIGLKLWKRRPLLITCWVYYVITVMPALGIIQVGGHSMADRFMYLPILGPLMVLGAFGAKAYEKKYLSHRLLSLSIISVSIVLSVLTVRQTSVWKDSMTLWKYVSENNPRAARAHYNLGNLYSSNGDFHRAIEAYKKAVRAEPAHSMAFNNLGNIYSMFEATAEAKKYYREAVRTDRNNVEAHYNLAKTLEKLNENEEAIKHYKMFLTYASSRHSHLFPEVKKKLSILIKPSDIRSNPPP